MSWLPTKKPINRTRTATNQPSAVHVYTRNSSPSQKNIKPGIRVMKPGADELKRFIGKSYPIGLPQGFSLKSKPKDNTNIDLSKFNLKNQYQDFTNRVKNYFKSLFNNFFSVRTAYLLTKNLIVGFMIGIVVFIGYLSFFDKTYLIKDWQVEFTKGSYLDMEKTQSLIKSYQDSRFLALFPNNQYWFATVENLTFYARTEHPEVELVNIKERKYPNSIILQVTTAPVLATISVNTTNGNESWRVSRSGLIITKDSGNLNERVVHVERNISFDRPNATLEDTSFFQSNIEQLDRLYFIDFLWSVLSKERVEISYTSIPSLNSADKEVTIHLTNGTRLIFDSSKLDKDSITNRIQTVLRSQIGDSISNGRIQYIDMRIPRRIFTCCTTKA